MNDHKLYTVVGGGYRNILRAALISRLYPYVGSDIVTANPLTIVSASIQDAVVYEVTENLNISSLGILSGILATVQIPLDHQEFVTISSISVVNGDLREVVISPENATTETVNLSTLALISGELKNVVVPVESGIETINMSNLSIISGSLV